ncbi:MAG: MerR family transcriptional regulator [Peptococcaceae bacterium]|nr:MerR family transcriptional regulator [Peptococcaceae bacterium]
MQFGFRPREVLALTGLTYRQLDYWDRVGLVKPSIARAEGKGCIRVYSFWDIVQLRVAKCLLEKGISFRVVKEVMGEVSKYSNADMVDKVVIITGDYVSVAVNKTPVDYDSDSVMYLSDIAGELQKELFGSQVSNY